MATTFAVSGNPVKNNGGTVLQAGNTDSSVVKDLSIATTTAAQVQYGSRVIEAVSPTSSGNLGTRKAVAGGVFGQMEAGEYVARVIGSRIAGQDNTIMRSPSSQYNHRPIHKSEGTRRLHETAWDYVTGAVTKGGNAGDAVTFGDDHAARPTDAVPGELVYMVKGTTPTQDDYKARTNP